MFTFEAEEVNYVFRCLHTLFLAVFLLHFAFAFLKPKSYVAWCISQKPLCIGILFS